MFVDRYNHELIDIHRLHSESMERYRNYLFSLIEDHAQETGSTNAAEIAADYYSLASRFWLVKPKASELSELFIDAASSRLIRFCSGAHPTARALSAGSVIFRIWPARFHKPLLMIC